MNAMVLAAGRGERMRPLSDVLPKPALPLIDQPVIASAIRLAATTDATRVVVNTWHLADEMEAALRPCEFKLAISREDELMGTAGGIALARDRGLLGENGPLLVVNGDGILNLNLAPVFRRMAGTDDLATLALLPHLDPRRWSRVILDQQGNVTRIEPSGTPEPGEVPLLYPGVMLVSREALKGIEVGRGGIGEKLWRPVMAQGRLGGAVVSGHWREVGTPPDFLRAVLNRLDGGCVIHPTALVDPTALVVSSLIGPGARVTAGAAVGEAVVTAGAMVESNARVHRSVLLGDVGAAAGEQVIDEFRAARRGSDRR